MKRSESPVGTSRLRHAADRRCDCRVLLSKEQPLRALRLGRNREAGRSGDRGTNSSWRIRFQPWDMTAHLYDITVRGTEPPDQPPLLHADKLTVRLRIVSASAAQVTLRELLIDRPVLHLQVGRDGKNNLPTAPSSQNSSHTSVFDLGVAHAQLTNGEVVYDDRSTPSEADFYDLAADIHFAPLDKGIRESCLTKVARCVMRSMRRSDMIWTSGSALRRSGSK